MHTMSFDIYMQCHLESGDQLPSEHSQGQTEQQSFQDYETVFGQDILNT